GRAGYRPQSHGRSSATPRSDTRRGADDQLGCARPALEEPREWSAAPDRRLALAAIEDAAGAILHPPGAAGSALIGAGERPRHPPAVDTGRGAVARCDLDRGVAALALARVDPARVTPAGILLRVRRGRHNRQHEDAEHRTWHARPHAPRSLAGVTVLSNRLRRHRWPCPG